jgi:hypothetical protein
VGKIGMGSYFSDKHNYRIAGLLLGILCIFFFAEHRLFITLDLRYS